MWTGWGRSLLALSLALSTTTGWAAEEEISRALDEVSSAVRQYNQNSGLDSAFRLLRVKSPPEREASSLGLQKLEFTLKEAECPNSRYLNPDDCDFKEQGVVKECSGTSADPSGAPSLQIKCDTIPQRNHRVKRHGKARRILRKLKKLLPGGGSIIAQAKPKGRLRLA